MGASTSVPQGHLLPDETPVARAEFSERCLCGFPVADIPEPWDPVMDEIGFLLRRPLSNARNRRANQKLQKAEMSVRTGCAHASRDLIPPRHSRDDLFPR